MIMLEKQTGKLWIQLMKYLVFGYITYTPSKRQATRHSVFNLHRLASVFEKKTHDGDTYPHCKTSMIFFCGVKISIKQLLYVAP